MTVPVPSYILAPVLWLQLLSGAAARPNAVHADACVNPFDGNPPAASWDRPAWKWTDTRKCKVDKGEPSLDEDGNCYNSMKPINDKQCAAWCITARGWHHGQPIDLMNGEICEAGNACSRTVQVSKNDGHSAQESWTQGTTHQWQEGATEQEQTQNAWGISASFKAGFLGTGASTGVKWDYSISKTHGQNWGMSLSKNFGTAGNIGTSNAISISLSTSQARSGEKALSYCGSWYAVPKLYFRCGVMAIGDYNGRNCEGDTKRQKPVCGTEVKVSSYQEAPVDGGPDDTTLPEHIQGRKFYGETIQHDMAFVRKDCQTREILPADFQEESFRKSMSFLDYYNEHITRYEDWHRGHHQPLQQNRNEKDEKQLFGIPHISRYALPDASERSIGPQNFTIKTCMKENVDGDANWCTRHALKDGQCLTFGRGAERYPFTKIMSAETSEGNCCVLFSKNECLGLAQKIIGRIENFRSFNFMNKAHSVVCGVYEYCHPGSAEIAQTGENGDGIWHGQTKQTH